MFKSARRSSASPGTSTKCEDKGKTTPQRRGWFRRRSAAGTADPGEPTSAELSGDSRSAGEEDEPEQVDESKSGDEQREIDEEKKNPKSASNAHKSNARGMNSNGFFSESSEINRYTLHEVRHARHAPLWLHVAAQRFHSRTAPRVSRRRVHTAQFIGKGSYGVVSSATDRNDGSSVAIKKITDVFENVSDATRILREIKLLRLLKHRDIVSVRSILLPPNEHDFKDIYVIFELMETDLHQVIKANDDMTMEHYRYFLYQLMRGLKYIHTAKIYHRDLKPKNVLVNSDCKLKICDFGLARPMFDDAPQTVFWTDYVATRWYRAPELCGSFFTKYSPSVDVWSIGCIFAEIITRKPLFPGKNVVDQLQIITELIGTPNAEEIAQVRNEKARRFLQSLPPKESVPFSEVFPGVDPDALDLLRLMLQFDPRKRPSPTEALEHKFLKSLHNINKEPECAPVSKLDFGFEFKKMDVDGIRKLIYREILEYHPDVLAEKVANGEDTMHYVVPDAADRFRKQFADLEVASNNNSHGTKPRTTISMPAEKIKDLRERAGSSGSGVDDAPANEVDHPMESPSR